MRMALHVRLPAKTNTFKGLGSPSPPKASWANPGLHNINMKLSVVKNTAANRMTKLLILEILTLPLRTYTLPAPPPASRPFDCSAPATARPSPAIVSVRQMEIADGDDDVRSDQQYPFKPIRLAILNQLTGDHRSQHNRDDFKGSECQVHRLADQPSDDDE